MDLYHSKAWRYLYFLITNFPRLRFVIAFLAYYVDSVSLGSISPQIKQDGEVRAQTDTMRLTNLEQECEWVTGA